MEETIKGEQQQAAGVLANYLCPSIASLCRQVVRFASRAFGTCLLSLSVWPATILKPILVCMGWRIGGAMWLQRDSCLASCVAPPRRWSSSMRLANHRQAMGADSPAT